MHFLATNKFKYTLNLIMHFLATNKVKPAFKLQVVSYYLSVILVFPILVVGVWMTVNKVQSKFGLLMNWSYGLAKACALCF